MSPRDLVGGLGASFRSLSSRDRRAVLLGFAVLVPALLWVGVVRPYLGALEDLSERAVSERALLEREAELLRDAPGFPDRLRAARAAVDRWDARLVRSSNLALAEAEVTALLEEVARERRVLLQEVRAAGGASVDDAPAGLRPIRLSVRGESDFEGILGFVHGMEEDPLLLRIVGFSMEALPAGAAPAGGGGGGQGAGAGGAGGSRSGVMSFMVIVEAFAPEEATGVAANSNGEER
jgi:hypothetical protein